MPENYDSFDRQEDFRDAPDDADRVIRAARARTSAPGMFLILFGILGFLLEIACLGLAFAAPTFFYDQYIKFLDQQPQNPQIVKAKKDLEAQKDSMSMNNPMNIGGAVLGAALSLLMVVGGAKMRNLQSYGLSMTGAIIGLLPCAGCCICAMPIGLWAVIVLANGDVKRAFQLNSRR